MIRTMIGSVYFFKSDDSPFTKRMTESQIVEYFGKHLGRETSLGLNRNCQRQQWGGRSKACLFLRWQTAPKFSENRRGCLIHIKTFHRSFNGSLEYSTSKHRRVSVFVVARRVPYKVIDMQASPAAP